jgi:hypothetical protein
LGGAGNRSAKLTMTRYCFFSFDYKDVKNFKVNVVRNSWLINRGSETFVDGSIWEAEKLTNPAEIKRVIDSGMNRTSVTCVLIGENTSSRRFVNYEVIKSFEKGNGIVAININRIKGTIGLTKKGLNPLDRLGFFVSKDGKRIQFFELKNYKWRPFSDLLEINNKKSNSVYFSDGFFSNRFGNFYKFSSFFPSYCWVADEGHTNLGSWIDEAATSAHRSF